MRWIHENRLFASKFKGRWIIPHADAHTFERGYRRSQGTPLEVDPYHRGGARSGALRKRPEMTRATQSQHFDLKLTPVLLAAIDQERIEDPAYPSRVQLVCRILEKHYLKKSQILTEKSVDT
jgi:hypothetical protein